MHTSRVCKKSTWQIYHRLWRPRFHFVPLESLHAWPFIQEFIIFVFKWKYQTYWLSGYLKGQNMQAGCARSQSGKVFIGLDVQDFTLCPWRAYRHDSCLLGQQRCTLCSAVGNFTHSYSISLPYNFHLWPCVLGDSFYIIQGSFFKNDTIT